jgi:hypothetical protein
VALRPRLWPGVLLSMGGRPEIRCGTEVVKGGAKSLGQPMETLIHPEFFGWAGCGLPPGAAPDPGALDGAERRHGRCEAESLTIPRTVTPAAASCSASQRVNDCGPAASTSGGTSRSSSSNGARSSASAVMFRSYGISWSRWWDRVQQACRTVKRPRRPLTGTPHSGGVTPACQLDAPGHLTSASPADGVACKPCEGGVGPWRRYERPGSGGTRQTGIPLSPFGCGPKPHAWLTWCGSI